MKKIDELFNELSEMIPEMKENSKEWKAFLEEFISQQPDSKIDTAFKKELKKQIMERMNNKIVHETSSDRISPWKTILGLASALAILSIVVFPSWNADRQGTTSIPSTEKSASGITAINVNSVEEEAFGDLDIKQNATTASDKELTNPTVSSRPQSGGGGGMAMDMIYPMGRTNFIYEYTGEAIAELPTQSAVYRRMKKIQNGLGVDLEPLLEKIGMSAVDLNKFGTLDVRQIGLGQTEGEMPYMVNIDYYYGNISINPDYEIWQRVTCPSGICDYQPFEKKDLLSDTEIIRIAREFASRFNISLENTGTPEIQKYWEITPMLDTNGKVVDPESYPDTLTVIFPTLINDKPVKDGSGSMGIMIDVNMREKAVTNANIPLLSLESSNYNSQTVESLLSAASRGGYDGIQYNNPDREIKLKIGTPKRELRRIWRQKEGSSEELFLEMLVFPVLKQDTTVKDYYVPTEIVVPIANTL